jgi:hypothetical protein
MLPALHAASCSVLGSLFALCIRSGSYCALALRPARFRRNNDGNMPHILDMHTSFFNLLLKLEVLLLFPFNLLVQL